MKLIKSLLILSSISLALIASGQNEVDALRYSQSSFGGTARYMGLSGAFGALGADFSTLSSNPAGIGVYTKSEFTFTPSLYMSKTNSTYYGHSSDDKKYNFNLGSIGVVFNVDIGSSSSDGGWRSVSFGFGTNRIQNFNNRILFSGTNPENSLLDAYVDYSNGFSTDELNAFDTELAYETYLIDPIPNTNNYTNRAPLYPDGSIAPVDQRKSILTEGSMNELVFSVGGNYADKLYLGATIGLPYIRYYEESSYEEINTVTDDSTTFNNFSKYDELETTGTGFNFKFGVIYRITDWVRIGAALHTPTFFNNMNDEWQSSMRSSLNNGESYSWSSPLGAYDYELETPMKLLGNIAFVIGSHGLISADYEYIDYTKARLRSDDDYGFFDENDAIENLYTYAHNIRIGTEWRLKPLSFRAGYAYYGSPYESGVNDGDRSSISLGIGIRGKYYFADFAYTHTSYDEDYYPYSSASTIAQPVLNEFSKNNFLLTIGMNF